MDAEHEFEDDAYVRRWAETADQRRPERAQMFRHVCELVAGLGRRAPHVVELGCGPGTLGAAVLEHVSDATYEGMDFSRPMLTLAAERLARFGDRVRLHTLDLRDGGWTRVVRAAPDVILTNQALHDLGSAEAVEETYRRVRAALSPGGLFVNAELVVPEGGNANKPGKLPVARHLALLEGAGFRDVRSDVAFGEYVALVARNAPAAAR